MAIVMDINCKMALATQSDYIVKDVCSSNGSSSNDISPRGLGSQFAPFGAPTASIAEVPVRVPLIQMEERTAGAVDGSLVALGTATSMSKSSRPRLPDNFNNLLTKPRLKALKQYIGSFQYRLNSQTNFNAHKLRPLSRIMDTARMIVYAPQPIKCVEAVFVALYLTAGLPDVERVPLGFKTELYGQVYQHIVLLVQHFGKYGAFGISRCPDLMNKDLIFDSMSSIIENFKSAYEEQRHIVLKIRVGLPVEHNIMSAHFVCWRHLNLNLKYQPWPECIDVIDKHAPKGKRLWDLWILSGKGEDPHISCASRKAPLDTKSSVYDKAKKKVVSQEASLLKSKSVLEQRIDSEASSSRVRSESNVVASGASTSRESSESDPVAEASDSRNCIPMEAASSGMESERQKKCLESTVVAFPATVGNSNFRGTKKPLYSGSAESGNAVRGAKLMRAASLPRSARNIDQTLAVSRGFLKSRHLKGTSGNGGKTAVHGPKMSARRKLVVIGRNSLLLRIPARVSYQTLNAGTLLSKPAKRAVSG